MPLLSRNGLSRGSIQGIAEAASVSLTEEQTDALTAGRQHYAYQLRDTTADTTLAVGLMTVRAS